jgi:lipopolysaccharide assembly outer membrane protein LptD (OstA)
MQKFLFFIAMLPFMAKAQQPAKPATEKLKSFKLHYEKDIVISNEYKQVDGKKSSKTVETVPGEGNLNFGVNEGKTAQRAINATNNQLLHESENGYMVAKMVTLTCLNFPDLKADKFVYDQETERGLLSGSVTIVDHGTSKFLGDKVYLDLSADEYKIVSIK